MPYNEDAAYRLLSQADRTASNTPYLMVLTESFSDCV